MAGKINIAGASKGLDAVTGRATQTSHTEYLGLASSTLTASSTLASMTEFAPTGYARQTCAMTTPSGTPRVTSNTSLLTFGPLTGASGATAVTHFFGTTASSGTSGDVDWQGDWSASRTPNAGDSLTVAIGAVTVQID